MWCAWPPAQAAWSACGSTASVTPARAAGWPCCLATTPTPCCARRPCSCSKHPARTRQAFDLPHPSSSAIQRRVARAAGHSSGATTSYGALARALGSPAAVRAVGGRGRNPISIVVPCHRALGAGGALTGYAGGLARKQALLRLEGAPPSLTHHNPCPPSHESSTPRPPARPRPDSAWLGESSCWPACGAPRAAAAPGAAEFGPLPLRPGLRVLLATCCSCGPYCCTGQRPAAAPLAAGALLCGLINSAIPFALFAWAVMTSPPAWPPSWNAACAPLFGALVAWLWLGDRINRLRWLGLALGFVGVALLAAGARLRAWGSRAARGGLGDRRLPAGVHLLCRGSAALRGATCRASAAGHGHRNSQPGAALGLPMLVGLAGKRRPAPGPLWPGWPRTGIAFILYFRIINRAGQPGPGRDLSGAGVRGAVRALFLGETVTPWMLGCGVVIVCGTTPSTGLVRAGAQRRPRLRLPLRLIPAFPQREVRKRGRSLPTCRILPPLGRLRWGPERLHLARIRARASAGPTPALPQRGRE